MWPLLPVADLMVIITTSEEVCLSLLEEVGGAVGGASDLEEVETYLLMELTQPAVQLVTDDDPENKTSSVCALTIFKYCHSVQLLQLMTPSSLSSLLIYQQTISTL